MESFEFPADAVAPSAARDAVARFAPWDRIDDVVLMVSELVANAVRHGPHDAGGVTVRVLRDTGVLRVEVEDGGTGWGPGGVPAGSLGLRIVAALAHRWGVTAEPTTVVWFEVPA